jgi:hypothetical protein
MKNAIRITFEFDEKSRDLYMGCSGGIAVYHHFIKPSRVAGIVWPSTAML